MTERLLASMNPPGNPKNTGRRLLRKGTQEGMRTLRTHSSLGEKGVPIMPWAIVFSGCSLN